MIRFGYAGKTFLIEIRTLAMLVALARQLAPGFVLMHWREGFFEPGLHIHFLQASLFSSRFLFVFQQFAVVNVQIFFKNKH